MKLGVNIDHVATLRQARGTLYPEPLQAAILVQAAGADSITVHLREDRRHIQDHDVIALKQSLAIPLNLEMAVTDAMLAFATDLKPDYCCLVPEKRAELTTEGGLDVVGQLARVRAACTRLGAADIRVSLFIDADSDQVEAAARAGAPVVEIHTGHYANAADVNAALAELNRVESAIRLARQSGLQVSAGHGLNYDNVQPIAAMPDIIELNIGHSIIARAVLQGLPKAVSVMQSLIRAARIEQ